MNKNSILAVVLSGILLFAWVFVQSKYFTPKPQVTPVEQTNAAAENSTQDAEIKDEANVEMKEASVEEDSVPSFRLISFREVSCAPVANKKPQPAQKNSIAVKILKCFMDKMIAHFFCKIKHIFHHRSIFVKYKTLSFLIYVLLKIYLKINDLVLIYII